MCENTAAKNVSFTGSTPVAKLLYGMASSILKKVSLEAGGNAPFIVFDDADIDAAIEGASYPSSRAPECCADLLCLQASWRASSVAQAKHAYARTVYTSSPASTQSSLRASRSASPRSRSATASTKTRTSPPPLPQSPTDTLDSRRRHGPLIHERAVEKMQRHVDDAVAQGAQVLLGDARLPRAGSFAPTVLADVPAGALVNTEETFGPLAALTRFETEEEVIRLANDAPVGLAGYFFSKDAARVWRVAEALEVSMVGSNTGSIDVLNNTGSRVAGICYA